MILGNDLAGDKVWADGVPLIVKPLTFHTVVAVSGRTLDLDVFPLCAVFRAASCDASECMELPGSLLTDQLAGSQAELVAEHRVDSSLTEFFDRAEE